VSSPSRPAVSGVTGSFTPVVSKSVTTPQRNVTPVTSQGAMRPNTVGHLVPASDRVTALFSYTAQEEDELSFTKDSVITVLSREGGDWWKVYVALFQIT